MKRIILVIVLLVAVSAASAQTCGNGVPCKPSKWSLPQLPDLSSPTPIVYDGSGSTGETATPAPATIAPSPVYTMTPVPTFTPFLDTEPLDNAIGTLDAITSGTSEPVLNPEGTPVDKYTYTGEIISSSNTIFSYLKGFNANMFGSFSPIFLAGIAGFSLLIFSKTFSIITPIFFAIFGIIRKIVEIILNFIPF